MYIEKNGYLVANPKDLSFLTDDREFSDDIELAEIFSTNTSALEAIDQFVEGLSILGGEPMHPMNIEGTTELAKKFKEKFPNKNLWVWTGFLFDRDLQNKEVLKYIDVLVDGQYVDELRDPRLKYNGSSNQRVIDVQNSVKQGKVIFYKDK